ncbi:MAG: glycosyltransferase family 4 protein [Eudoraea sp.]|nr:glycosyltransferase family 4 protein [Eudoraea sp.]MBT8291707.1 glycosyltransferase family 4 protein [Eudoraea sp.]
MKSNKVLILGLNWPEPKATAAGIRMMQLIHWFLEKNFQITFASTAAFNDYSADLTSMGIDQQPIKLNDQSFDDFVLRLDPSIVIFDRFIMEEQFGWRVAENLPEALRILDTEDLHSLRSYREKVLSDQKLFSIPDWLSLDITKRELASIFRSDLSVIISKFEIELLHKKVKIDNNLLFYLPFIYEELTETIVKNWLPFEERKHFVFIGNGKHAPNIDAILWLNRSIWPIIRKSLPQSELHIYGPYIPERILKMDNEKTGFRIKGWAKDVASVMSKAKLNLVPLRFGAGIKGKLLEGFRNGTPAITTSVGIEGIDHTDELKLCTRDDAISFSNLAIELYQNNDNWKKVQNLGIDLINKHFSNEMIKEEFFGKIFKLTTNLNQHRVANIIGGILTHSSLQSTKYLSKWIEAKNKMN